MNGIRSASGFVSALILLATAAGCLTRAETKVEFIMHSITFEIDPDLSTSVYARLTNGASTPTESWDYSVRAWYLASDRTVVGGMGPGGDGALGVMIPETGKDVSIVDAEVNNSAQASYVWFSFEAFAGGEGWGSYHDFNTRCISVQDASMVYNCGQPSSGGSGVVEVPEPDEQVWRDTLLSCCAWKHRPVDVYAIACDVSGNLSPERVECALSLGNVEKTETLAKARLEVFTNDTLDGTQQEIGKTTTQSTHPLKHREAERLDVSLNVPPDAVPTLSKTFLVRVTAFPDGNEDAAAIEERWVTWMALNETDERQPPDAASDRGSSTRP